MKTQIISFVVLFIIGISFPSTAGAFQRDFPALSSIARIPSSAEVDGGNEDGDGWQLLQYNVSLLALTEGHEKATAVSDIHGNKLHWHKILGYGTIVAAIATVATGFTGPEGPHCGMAALSTGLAAATCVNGFWTYGNIFTTGDTRLNVHAMSGMLSTIGFGAATILADDAPHGEIGAASGMLFMVTLGVVYF